MFILINILLFQSFNPEFGWIQILYPDFKFYLV